MLERGAYTLPERIDLEAAREAYSKWFPDITTRFKDVNEENLRRHILLPHERNRLVELHTPSGKVWFTWNRIGHQEAHRLIVERRIHPNTWTINTTGDLWIMHLWTTPGVPAREYARAVARWFVDSGFGQPRERVFWYRCEEYHQRGRGRFAWARLPAR